jgi:hypothetical protein
MTESNTTISKFWLKSKTVLFNAAMAAAGVWTTIEAATQQLHASISAKNFGLIMAAVGIVGGLLRAVSSSKLHMKKPSA